MAEVPRTEPESIRAGDTISWRKSLSDYPASEYVLAYRFISAAGTIDVEASPDGTDHLVEIDAATSAAYIAGDYTWFSFATTIAAPTKRTTIGQGHTLVLADPATATDLRSHVKKVLDAIEAAIEGRASYTDLEYEIAGKRVRSMDPEQLIKWHSHYKSLYKRELDAERVKQGLGTRRQVAVRFKRV